VAGSTISFTVDSAWDGEVVFEENEDDKILSAREQIGKRKIIPKTGFVINFSDFHGSQSKGKEEIMKIFVWQT
jgi:hypothetical protein